MELISYRRDLEIELGVCSRECQVFYYSFSSFFLELEYHEGNQSPFTLISQGGKNTFY